MGKVLCICGWNTWRSPMVAAFLQKELGDGFKVESAGIHFCRASYPVNRVLVDTMTKRGFNIKNHKNRWICDLDLGNYSHIVSTSERDTKMVVSLLKDIRHNASLITVVIDGGDEATDPFWEETSSTSEYVTMLEEVVPKIAEQILR